MNKKGQTLILFVIMIPIVLGLCALVVDVGVLVSKNVQLEEISKTIIEDVWDSANAEEIKDIFVENDIPVDQLDVSIDTSSIHIKNSYEVDSIFGSIIGIDNYEVSVDITGTFQDGKIVFE